jgi:hypothetical protein
VRRIARPRRATSRGPDPSRHVARAGSIAPRRAVTRLRRLAARGVEATAAALGAREGVREPLARAPAGRRRLRRATSPRSRGRLRIAADTPRCERAAAPRAGSEPSRPGGVPNDAARGRRARRGEGGLCEAPAAGGTTDHPIYRRTGPAGPGRGASSRRRRDASADQTRCRPNAMPTKTDAGLTRSRPRSYSARRATIGSTLDPARAGMSTATALAASTTSATPPNTHGSTVPTP